MNKRKIADLALSPFIYFSAVILLKVRQVGINHFPRILNALRSAGIFPLYDHYYEPLINVQSISDEKLINRELPSINFRANEQLNLLAQFNFTEELRRFPLEKSGNGFFLQNGNFEGGDADFWYNFIRHKKPGKIIEIGSGYSTLVALAAIEQNRCEDTTYQCNLVCVEPFEMPWLEKTDATIIRKKVEDLPPEFFMELKRGDVLFIDSSHMIRPQGDVLHLFLSVLPSLAEGVIVHVHDIFSPRNYPKQWLKEDMRFWNEQYLLEAILTSGTQWEIVAALNYLRHNHFSAFCESCAFLEQKSEPGSFYIQRIP